MSSDFSSKRGLKFDPKFTLSSRVAFHSSDFIEPALVAAAEIGGGQESLDHFHGGFGRDDASPEGEDVSVVVFAGEAGGHHIVGPGRRECRGLCWRRWKCRCLSRIRRCPNRLLLKPRVRLRLFRNRDSRRTLPTRYPGRPRRNPPLRDIFG